MRIGVISDIHGNIAALDAVLADLAARGVTEIVNLGDICSGGLFPEQTADRLMPLHLPTIRGNHERQVSTQSPEAMGPSDRHALETLRPEQRDWIAGLPAELRLPGGVLLVHGTPGSDIEYLLETVTPEGLRPATDAEIRMRLGKTDAEIVLCGHTHLPRVVALPAGPWVVNPGSVGLPAYDDDRPWPHVVEAGTPHARYAIVSRGASGWTAELVEVVYDWEQAARDAEANGRSDWATALRSGRVRPPAD